MKPINTTTKKQLDRILDSIHNELEKLVEIRMNVDEFKLMDSFKLNTNNILDSINDMRFQSSQVHYEEQLEKNNGELIEGLNQSLNELKSIRTEVA